MDVNFSCRSPPRATVVLPPAPVSRCRPPWTMHTGKLQKLNSNIYIHIRRHFRGDQAPSPAATESNQFMSVGRPSTRACTAGRLQDGAAVRARCPSLRCCVSPRRRPSCRVPRSPNGHARQDASTSICRETHGTRQGDQCCIQDLPSLHMGSDRSREATVALAVKRSRRGT